MNSKLLSNVDSDIIVFKNFIKNKRSSVENALEKSLDKIDKRYIGPSISYSLLSSQAKRIRPMLCIATSEYCGGNGNDVLPIACSIEMIHTASLIHDDLPSMDNSNFRRGESTNYKIFGEDIAILTGDALLGLSFMHLLENTVSSPDILLEVLKSFSYTVGPNGLALGQILDIKHCQLNNYDKFSFKDINEMYIKKTGILLEACVDLVCILHSTSSTIKNRLKAYSQSIGMAYQIIDDILDATANIETIGKDTRKDRELGKVNYASFYSIDKCKEIADNHIQNAISQIDRSRANSEVLIGLAKYIMQKLA